MTDSAIAQNFTVTLYTRRPCAWRHQRSARMPTATARASTDTIKAAANKVKDVTGDSICCERVDLQPGHRRHDHSPRSKAPPARSGTARTGHRSSTRRRRRCRGWPAGAFRLVGDELSRYPRERRAPLTYTNQLEISECQLVGGSGLHRAVHLSHHRHDVDIDEPPIQIQEISSGTQVKHTDPGFISRHRFRRFRPRRTR